MRRYFLLLGLNIVVIRLVHAKSSRFSVVWHVWPWNHHGHMIYYQFYCTYKIRPTITAGIKEKLLLHSSYITYFILIIN